MKLGTLGGAIAALCVAGLSNGAHATTWEVNCQGLDPGGDTTLTNTSVAAPTENFGTEPGAISGSGAGAGQPDALGALLGTPDQGTDSSIQTTFATTLAAGDTVEVTGICNQILEIRQSALAITGRTGNIDLAQGSNGFVNLSTTPGHTLTNTVSAGISCPFATVPASHLQLGHNSITPAPTLATSFSSATSPQCLPF